MVKWVMVWVNEFDTPDLQATGYTPVLIYICIFRKEGERRIFEITLPFLGPQPEQYADILICVHFCHSL